VRKQQYVPNEKRIAAAEQKWFDTYKPQGRVSGKYLFPMPDYVYAPAGGYSEIDRKHKNAIQ